MGKPTDLVQGTLDLLILKTVALEPKHGWAIAKRIQQVSNETLRVPQGSLYPALHRLEQQGWIRAKWQATDTGREAKFYSLTRAGQKHLDVNATDVVHSGVSGNNGGYQANPQFLEGLPNESAS